MGSILEELQNHFSQKFEVKTTQRMAMRRLSLEVGNPRGIGRPRHGRALKEWRFFELAEGVLVYVIGKHLQSVPSPIGILIRDSDHSHASRSAIHHG